MEQMKSLGC